MDQSITDLITQTQANDDAEAAATKAFSDFAVIWQTKINAASSLSPADKQTLLDTATAMKTSAAALGAAVVANTPAA